MKKYALALLLLSIHSSHADALGPNDPVSHKALPAAERYSRPISEENPFGIDFGVHPITYTTSPQGVPTHQLSMFHAQIIFAESACTATPKPTRFQRGFHMFFLLAYDKDFSKPYKSAYAQAVEAIRARYQHAWDGMNESQKSTFCAEYWGDIRYFVETSVSDRVRRLPTGSIFYLGALSPLSSESIEELERKAKAKEDGEKVLLPILILGQALVLAGGASASMDALSAQKSGNNSLAQVRLAQSRSLLRLTSDIGSVGIASQTMGTQTLPSQQPVQSSCQTLDHFDQYVAEPDSDVWKKYQSLSTGCDAFNKLLRERFPSPQGTTP